MSDVTLSCPVPISDHKRVLLSHGGGGRLTADLIEMFSRAFDNEHLREMHDGARLPCPGGRLAFTTDSYVVHPLFFPGGDIGHLAVCGTVNDLAVCGATPLWMSAGFILEEGLDMDVLRRVVTSMASTAAKAKVSIVTGDTKVVERGKGDGIFINTSGIGWIPPGVDVSPASVRPGDAVVLSGDIARHGMALLAVREGLSFESAIESDTAPLNGMVADILRSGIGVRCMRDATRGGLATVLLEIARASNVQCEIEEGAVPVHADVSSACEILGLDPLYVANEGKFVAFVAAEDAERAVKILRGHAAGREASVIGRVCDGTPGLVVLNNRIGTRRSLSMLSGEQLPRIC